MIFPEAQQNDTQNTLTHEKIREKFLAKFLADLQEVPQVLPNTHHTYTNDDRKTMAHTRVENRGVQTVR